MQGQAGEVAGALQPAVSVVGLRRDGECLLLGEDHSLSSKRAIYQAVHPHGGHHKQRESDGDDGRLAQKVPPGVTNQA